MKALIKRHRKSIKWGLLLILLVLTGVLFVELTAQQSMRTHPNRVKNSLEKSGQLLELRQWAFKFQSCDFASEPTQCKWLSLEPKMITLPSPGEIRGLLKNEYPEANVAIGEYTFNEKQMSWLEARKNSVITLSIPNNVQVNSYAIVGRSVYRTSGMGVHSVFHFPADVLLKNRHLTLEYEFAGVGWFGPPDLPPALSDPHASSAYLSLRERQLGSADLARQLQIGFPFIIAAIALVLDHSRAFAILSLFGATQSASSFLSYFVDNEILSHTAWFYMTLGIHGMAFAILIILVLELSELRTAGVKRWEPALIAGSVLLISASYSLGRELILKIDSYTDLAAASLGSLILTFGIVRKITSHRKQVNSKSEGEVSTGGANTATSASLKILRMGIALGGLGAHALANFQDLFGGGDESFRNALEWKHNILFPSLICACLLEVGSTSRKMIAFATQMVQKALIERDLEMGRVVQQKMLPKRKQEVENFAWRSVYLPATSLAGDWFDIREVQLGEHGSVVLACIADVTGHGVGAALATSVVSSHWGLWCKEIEQGFKSNPEEIASLSHLLSQAPVKINEGLLALRQNENCTAIFCLCSSNGDQESDLYYATAGHPGAFASNGRNLRYLSTMGERLGASSAQEWPVQKTTLQEDEFVLFYSDGIVPFDKTISSWASQLKRELRRDKNATLADLLKVNIRRNRKAFREDRSIEDDITLLAIWPRKKVRAGYWPSRKSEDTSQSRQFPPVRRAE